MRFDEASGGVITDSKKKSIDEGVITFKLEADDDAHDDHGDIHVAGHLKTVSAPAFAVRPMR